MGAGEQEVLNLAVATTGRRPVFLTAGPVGYPTRSPADRGSITAVPADMISLRAGLLGGSAVTTLFEILLRSDPAHRTARASIEAFDAASTYRVTINGHNYDDGAGASIEATIDNLVTAINAGRDGTPSTPETESGRSLVELTAFDAATTYSAILDGITFSVSGTTDLPTTAALLRDAINSGPLSTKLSASVVGDNVQIDNLSSDTYTVDVAVSGGTGTIDMSMIPATATREGSGDSSVLLIEGTGEPDYTVSLEIVGGTGVWDPIVADATTVTFRLWGMARGRTVPTHWSGQDQEITRAFSERLTTAGYEYAQCQIVATDGWVHQWGFGPADIES